MELYALIALGTAAMSIVGGVIMCWASDALVKPEDPQ